MPAEQIGLGLNLLHVAAMAAKKGFEAFEPLFGEAATEMEGLSVSGGSGFHRLFLFFARALDPYRIDIAVTDFCSHTLERVLTVQDVEDMRDESGVSGSFSEFLDYFMASLLSDDVRLVIGGGPTAKLVARKSKGMPRISIDLQKLSGSSSSDVMGNLSLTLYRDLKEKRAGLTKECRHRSELEKLLSAEMEKSKHLERQLDSLSFKRKVSQPKLSENVNITDVAANSDAQKPPEKSSERDSPSTKTGQRSVPAYRRAKVRGALLANHDPEDL